jgi:folate-binding protein YgfZ
MVALGQKSFVLLDGRGVLAVGGADARGFLQGLVSNDIDKVGPARAIYAALLNAQGKYLHDFFIAEIEGSLVIDCEGARCEDLKRRLGFFKLRAEVTIADASDRYAVAALLGDGPHDSESLRGQEGQGGPFAGGICFVDPRFAGIGARAILPKDGAHDALRAAGFTPAAAEDYDRARLGYGLPDASQDLSVEKSLLLESGFEELNGVDWDKGCYVGQELTARTKYRGLVRKRLMPVTIEGPLPPSGTPIMLGGKQAGEMRSGRGQAGIALLRLELVERAEKQDEAFTADGARLKAHKPDWMEIGSPTDPAG